MIRTVLNYNLYFSSIYNSVSVEDEFEMAVNRDYKQSNDIDDCLLEFEDLVECNVGRTWIQIDRQNRLNVLIQFLSEQHLDCVDIVGIILDYAATRIESLNVMRSSTGIYVYCNYCQQRFENESINKCIQIQEEVYCNNILCNKTLKSVTDTTYCCIDCDIQGKQYLSSPKWNIRSCIWYCYDCQISPISANVDGLNHQYWSCRKRNCRKCAQQLDEMIEREEDTKYEMEIYHMLKQ
eukprot:327816_1